MSEHNYCDGCVKWGTDHPGCLSCVGGSNALYEPCSIVRDDATRKLRAQLAAVTAERDEARAELAAERKIKMSLINRASHINQARARAEKQRDDALARVKVLEGAVDRLVGLVEDCVVTGCPPEWKGCRLRDSCAQCWRDYAMQEAGE